MTYDIRHITYRLAKHFPSLREAALVRMFKTPWPRMSYEHEVDITKGYRYYMPYILSFTTIFVLYYCLFMLIYYYITVF
jgi:hypothetical protein